MTKEKEVYTTKQAYRDMINSIGERGVLAAQQKPEEAIHFFHQLFKEQKVCQEKEKSEELAIVVNMIEAISDIEDSIYPGVPKAFEDAVNTYKMTG